MNIEEIYLDKIWSVVNDGLPEGELMLSGNDQDKVEKTLEEYHQAKLKLLGIANVSSCYAVFDEEGTTVQLYQTEDKANKGLWEFQNSHPSTEFYIDTMQIN